MPECLIEAGFVSQIEVKCSIYPCQPGLWRFRLEDTHPGQRCGFASLEAMVVCLQTELINDKGGKNVLSR
jgi:hypothetical protein